METGGEAKGSEERLPFEVQASWTEGRGTGPPRTRKRKVLPAALRRCFVRKNKGKGRPDPFSVLSPNSSLGVYFPPR